MIPYRQARKKVRSAKSQINEIERAAGKQAHRNQKAREKEEQQAKKAQVREEQQAKRAMERKEAAQARRQRWDAQKEQLLSRLKKKEEPSDRITETETENTDFLPDELSEKIEAASEENELEEIPCVK